MRKLAFVLLMLLCAVSLSAQASLAKAEETPPPIACDPHLEIRQPASAGSSKLFGVVEDSGQTANCDLSMDRMQSARDLGAEAVRILLRWGPGDTYTPDQTRLQEVVNNVISIRAKGGDPILLFTADWNRQRNLHMPLRPSDQRQFMHFVTWWYTHLVDLGVTKVAVLLEPNSGHFWYPQCSSDPEGDAPHSVTRLMMMVYADLHKAAEAKNSQVTVIGPELSSHGQNQPEGDCKSWSPVDFFLAMGKAKVEYCRQKPQTCGQKLWDWVSIHPYGLTNSEPPDRVHFDGTIGFADYRKLRRTLCQAFHGSAQSCWTPVFYSEWGVQTVIPTSKAGAYSGKETVDAVSFDTQVAFVKEAIHFTFCQKGVIGWMMFLNTDESVRNRWQSGANFADGTPKPSWPGINLAFEVAQAGMISCEMR